MIRHVVIFEWNDDVDDAHVAAVAAGLDRLAATLPTVGEYRHGSDLGLAEGNADYVIVGDFDSLEDYVAYRDHPDHRAFIADLIAGRVKHRSAVQYEVG